LPHFDTLIIEGRAYSWQQLRAMRREQAEARRAAQGRQLALFELKDDARPAFERRASDRYEQPSMLDLLRPAEIGAK